MKNFVRWLKQVSYWVRRIPITRHYWVAFAVVAVTVVVLGACGWTEDAFRLSGMGLQLGGVFTVALGILKTRTEFRHASVWSQFRSWVKTFPPLHPPKMTASGHSSMPGLTGEGYGYSTHGPAADQTIEGRLGHLEDVVKKLAAAHGRTYIAVLQAEKKAQKALDEQARMLSSQIDTVHGKIEATATGGLHISAVGAILIFFGTVFGSAGHELHGLLTP